MKRTFVLTTISIAIILLVLNNTLYYFLSKQNLTNDLKTNLQSIATQIQLSVENSRYSASFLEDSISIQLRTAAVTAKLTLDPDIEKVTSAQLKALSQQLGIKDITLLKKTDDDIFLYRSSDPKEEGVSTKTWKPWYQAFQELFEYHKVINVDRGFKSEHYWAGPFEYSATDTTKTSLEKYGYYYDGTTNYIINPYVSDKSYIEFQRSSGVDAIVDSTQKEQENLLEITAFNPVTFGEEDYVTKTHSGEDLEHNATRSIIYGHYTYQSSKDIDTVRHVAESNKPETIIQDLNGVTTLKMFIPVDIKADMNITNDEGKQLTRYVLSLTSNYDKIEGIVAHKMQNLIIMIAAATIVTILIVMTLMRYFTRSRDRVVGATQETYIDEVNQMFMAVRGQRHDLLNHISTVHSLVTLKKYNELENYTQELVGDIQEINDIITIGHPAIAALIQTKSSIAVQRRIKFTQSFPNITYFRLGVRSVDIIRIIGNLIDNAFDAVMELEVDKRVVDIKGWVTDDNKLHITVSNPGSISEKEGTLIFNAGFSSKMNHSGIGLAITKQLVNRYKGSIELNRDQPGIVKLDVSISID